MAHRDSLHGIAPQKKNRRKALRIAALAAGLLSTLTVGTVYAHSSSAFVLPTVPITGHNYSDSNVLIVAGGARGIVPSHDDVTIGKARLARTMTASVYRLGNGRPTPIATVSGNSYYLTRECHVTVSARLVVKLYCPA